jgi:chain length determinant protein tyrosine kinase EpsG
MNDLAQASPESLEFKSNIPIGRILLESGKINVNDLAKIVAVQKSHGLRFGDAAMRLGLIDEKEVKNVLAEQFAYTPSLDKTSNLDQCLTAAYQPDSLQAEALRSLRSELLLRYFNKAPNLALAVVGTDDADNIAITTANLAVVFAQMGIRTLLIDSNLRKPLLHNLFGISEREAGLSDLIAGRALAEPIAIPALRSLWVLPAGTPAPNPQELLASKYYAECMEGLRSSFDVTLISTPPSNSTRDAQLIACQAEACLLVAQQDQSRVKDIETLCTSLSALGVRLLGVALRQ